MNFFKQYLHWPTITFISIAFVWVAFNNARWNDHKVLRWDTYGYSQYLSSWFIYENIKDPQELIRIDSLYHPTDDLMYYGRHWVDRGRAIAFKYTMGNAIMMSPFYLTAHLITKSTKFFPADGYSEPYQFSVALSSLFWGICGMVALTLLLLRWFRPTTVSVTLLLIAFGTNYLYYVTLECGLTHVPDFFLITSAVLCTFLWLEQKCWKYAFLVGLASGMVALIRLPDMVFGIIPAVLFLKTFFESTRNEKNKLLLQAGAITVVVGLIFSPQMIYWKYVSGYWFHDSYVGEKFDFLYPHISDGLFSYKKGWLLYAPIMIFALAGIPLLLKKFHWIGYCVAMYVCIHIYVVFSWGEWWYGGSFGSRPMIQAYGILAIPLACFMNEFFLKNFFAKKFFSGAMILVVTFFVSLNLFQTYQYKLGILHYTNMNKTAYWGIWGKLRLTDSEFKEYYK
ncbi:MAG: hypothetical protein V4615_01710 [Bacteroidota bacterium]